MAYVFKIFKEMSNYFIHFNPYDYILTLIKTETNSTTLEKIYYVSYLLSL